MRVAICQGDGKWPNLALAKIAAWHRAHGDEVEHFMPLATYDRVYAGKVFTDTGDDPYLPVDAIKGGTGYDIGRDLPDYVERMHPDFSPWPRWKKSMGFTTRGCVRHCPFCVVPEKEGKLRVVAEFGDIWDDESREVIFLDNNVTAAPIEHFRSLCEDAKTVGVAIEFNQGLDARLLTGDHATLIATSPFTRCVRLAFDHVRDEAAVRRAVRLLTAAGVVASRLEFYVLIGFGSTPEQDLHRVEVLRSLGVEPFAMAYNRHDPYQRRFARWVNNRVAFKSMSWADWLATFKTPLVML